MATVSLRKDDIPLEILQLVAKTKIDLKSNSTSVYDESGILFILSTANDVQICLTIPNDRRTTSLSIDVIPGICKITYLTREGEELARDEWLVFGGKTELPVVPTASCDETPYAIYITNIGLA